MRNRCFCILAAGLGSRLKSYTEKKPKWLLPLGDNCLIDQYFDVFSNFPDSDILIVTGHGRDILIDYINKRYPQKSPIYIHNDIYDKTNNIYSLSLALSTLAKYAYSYVMECDLYVNKDSAINFINTSEDCAALVSPLQYWMDGTCVKINTNKKVTSFVNASERLHNTKDLYKTVNWYKFSSSYIFRYLIPYIDVHLSAHGSSVYYEDVIRVLTYASNDHLSAHIIPNINWFEIDDQYDLQKASCIQDLNNGNTQSIIQMYGGYWKIKDLTDLSLLVSPYFPSSEFIEEFSTETQSMLTQYPSTRNYLEKLSAKTLPVSPQFITLGNGASELISTILRLVNDTWEINCPYFLEYERASPLPLKYILNDQYTYENHIIIVNPCNPTGRYLPQRYILELAARLKKYNKYLLYDESFADFSDHHLSLLDDEVIKKNDNVLVLKSLGKSYGCAGIRLGALITANTSIYKALQNSLPIWNISSPAEIFLDLLPRYKKAYSDSLSHIRTNRSQLLSGLQQIPLLSTYSSEANFVLTQFPTLSSARVAEKSFLSEGFLVKLILDRPGLTGPAIRFPVHTNEVQSHIVSILSSQPGFTL